MMKRLYLQTALTAVVAVGLFTSCEKQVIDLSGFVYREELEQWKEEQDNSLNETEIIYKNIEITYPDMADDYVCTSIPYEGLCDYLRGGTENVLLLYLAVAGQGWTQLPIFWMRQLEDTVWMSYGVGNPGDIIVRYGLVNHQKFSAGQHYQNFRAVIIPTKKYDQLMAMGVDPRSCEAVEEGCRKLASTDPSVHINDITPAPLE